MECAVHHFGFEAVGWLQCMPVVSFPLLFIPDVDECELDIDNCHVNANCIDVIGSFDCTCNSGFEGDGVTCISKKFLCILEEGGHVLKSHCVLFTVYA